MRDPRIICRTELLETLYEEREALVDRAASVAASINDEDVDYRRVGVEVVCLLREVCVVDRLRDEIARATKHAPSPEAAS
jgi:hypothetical protein